MRSSSVGRRSSTNPVRISMFDREDRSLTRVDSRRTQTLKSKHSVSSAESSHIPRPRMQGSINDKASSRGSIFKATGKTSLSQHVPATPKTPVTNATKHSNVLSVGGSSHRNHAGLPTGRRSLSADRASNIGAKGPRKDTRPLTDKTFQAHMLSKIDNYFAATQCSTMLNSNGSLKPITLKMFVEVSAYLVKMLDIKQVLTMVNYVEELPKIAKKLHYPGIITKSWLKTANAMHSWPNVLGWICWLVEVCQVRDLASEMYNLNNLPFTGSERQAEINKNAFFSMLNFYSAWNDEKLDEEADLVEKYLQEIEGQQGVSEEDIAKAHSELEKDTLKLQREKQHSNNIDDEVKHLQEVLATLQEDEIKLLNDIEATEEYTRTINFEADRVNAECETLCEQIRLENEQCNELVLAIKQQPMSKAEKDKILEKCTEIQNYMHQFDDHLKDIQKELYTMDIKLASINNNLNKTILAYNKEIFMHLSGDIGVDLEELKMPEKNISRPDIMEVFNAKSALMDNLIKLLKTKLIEKERSIEANSNELEILQEKLKVLEDESSEVATKFKEKKSLMNKIKTEAKNEETKLKDQIKTLQNEIKEIQELMPDFQTISSELEETTDKLDAVRRKRTYIEESAKLFFSKFFKIIGEHRNELNIMLTNRSK